MPSNQRVVIVTGGANGIGRATVKHFYEQGARVAIWDLDDEAGRALESEIQAGNGQARYQKVNVTDPESVESGVREVVDRWGRIDVLINNAGILRDSQLVKYKEGQLKSRMSVEDFDAVITVNLRGVFLCTRAVSPFMIEQGAGRIINVSSVVGIYGNFGQTNYVAAKAGVIGMTRVWSRELGRYGITVNVIAPGFIETDMTRQMPEKILNMMVARTPLGRMGKPEDIAHAFAFLASDEAAFISGAVLPVDGGMVIGT
jgi:3-oxoacyl-[acyl-carrier protein] reductase